MVPKNITEKHINSAIQEVKRTGVPIGRASERYFLRFEETDYPPKLIISVANKFANQRELDPANFNTYEAQDVLRNLRFSIIDNKEALLSGYNGFKLISLDLRNNKLLGTIYYDFIEGNDSQNQIYTTVLIGANGTGKSNLFRTIIDLFRELFYLKEGKSSPVQTDGQYSLKYNLDGKLYDFTNFRNYEKTQHANFSNKLFYRYLLINGEFSQYKNAKFPAGIVANSIMLTDKYPVLTAVDQEGFSFYQYLGVRNSPQQASTRSYVRKTVEFIVDNINSQVFNSGVQKIAEFLTGSSSINIIFSTTNTTKFFRGRLTPITLTEYFEDIANRYDKREKTPPFKLNHYVQISSNDELIKDICEFCNEMYNQNRLQDIYKSSTKQISYDITNEESYDFLKSEFKMLEQLRLLGLLTSAEIIIGNDSKYNLQESSSGEYHFFSSMVGLMATVKPNSLIFIDEPEISLHPNWQMQYLSFIRQLFGGPEYATSHIFIATHSHFVISDLQGDNSKIIGLKRNKGIEIVDLPDNLDTFGWSAEDVLYNVFNVVSTRNRFVAETIGGILNELSNGDKKAINVLSKEKFNDLLSLEKSLKVRDPLKQVVLSIIQRIRN